MKEIKTVKYKSENLHVVFLFKKRSHSVSVSLTLSDENKGAYCRLKGCKA